MPTCTVCAAPLRVGARFCTQCGTPVSVAAPVAPPVVAPVAPVMPPPPAPESTLAAPVLVEHEPASLPVVEPQPEIPARIPSRGRITPPPARSTAATVAFVTGIAPLVVSVTGNLVSAQLSIAALERVAQGDVQGAWAPVLVTLALVFVANAALLTVCIVAGGRGLRETANGITRGRGLAIGGLMAGGLNLVLWVAGLIVSVSGLGSVLV